MTQKALVSEPKNIEKRMVNYWKSKVLPKIKKVFENPKKIAAAEACKAFDESKEQYSKEIEEKKTELHPKVAEIYEACPPEIKALVKEPKESTLKKNSSAVQKLLDELSKIEFPGSKPICEAASKVGAGYLPGPVFFVLEKVSTFVAIEEKKEEEEEETAQTAEIAATTEEKKEATEEAAAPSSASPEEIKEKEIVATEEKPEEEPPKP